VPICGHTLAPKDRMNLVSIAPIHRRHIFACLGVCAFAALLAGCAGSIENVGMATVDPAKFTFYNCDDLAARNRNVIARERELRDLMARAAAGPGGALVNALAYRSEYVSVRGELSLLRKVAAEKNCDIPQWKSDKVIR
jgi:hypothetical protein